MNLYAIALAFAATGAVAQEVTPSVEVPGMKDPDMRSYRNSVAGLDAFEKHRALAPAATELRFRLAPPKPGAPLPSGEALYLRIVGNGEPIPVPLDAQGTFTLPRVQAAIDDDADLILNRKKDVLRARPDIHTPGLPENTRRLGDLRLECQVNLAIGKAEIGLMGTLALNALVKTSDWCAHPNGQIWFDARGMIDGAEIVEGARRQAVLASDFSFNAPLLDQSWSNEARIELHYAAKLTDQEQANPWRQPLYLYGANHWATRTPLRQREDGIYEAEVELRKATHWLKAGTRALAAIDFGSAGKSGQQPADGTPLQLAAHGRKLQLKVTTAGRYAVTLDARDKDAPTLSVARRH